MVRASWPFLVVVTFTQGDTTEHVVSPFLQFTRCSVWETHCGVLSNSSIEVDIKRLALQIMHG